MKNKFMKIVFALLLCVCSVSMFACDKGSENTMKYDKLDSLIFDMGSDSMFVSDNIDGAITNFALRPFYENSGNYGYYNKLLVIPMTFITDYQGDLDKLASIKLSGEGKGAVNNFEKDLYKFSTNYYRLSTEYDRYVSFTNADIKAGALQTFRVAAHDFIGSAYDLAESLAEIEVKVFNKYQGLVTTAVTKADNSVISDYVSLKVGQEYYNLLARELGSRDYELKGTVENIEFVNFINQQKQNLSELISRFVNRDWDSNYLASYPTVVEGKEVYNNTKVSDILNKINLLASEKPLINEAFRNFSFRDFYTKYECKIAEYQKNNANVAGYYGEIQDYYNVYLPAFTDYIYAYFN